MRVLYVLLLITLCFQRLRAASDAAPGKNPNPGLRGEPKEGHPGPKEADPNPKKADSDPKGKVSKCFDIEDEGRCNLQKADPNCGWFADKCVDPNHKCDHHKQDDKCLGDQECWWNDGRQPSDRYCVNWSLQKSIYDQKCRRESKHSCTGKNDCAWYKPNFETEFCSVASENAQEIHSRCVRACMTKNYEEIGKHDIGLHFCPAITFADGVVSGEKEGDSEPCKEGDFLHPGLSNAKSCMVKCGAGYVASKKKIQCESDNKLSEMPKCVKEGGADAKKGAEPDAKKDAPPPGKSPPKAKGCSQNEALTGEKDNDYRGCQTKTRKGLTCQNWLSDEPQKRSTGKYNIPQMADKKEMGLDDHNYCRNPDGEDTIWCYTTTPGERWDYCDPLKGDESVASEALQSGDSVTMVLVAFIMGNFSGAWVNGYFQSKQEVRMPLLHSEA